MGRSKDNHNEVIMNSLQVGIKCFHEGVRYFLIKY